MLSRFAAGVVDLFLVIAELFLAFRVVLRFFAANGANSFVHFIYTSSNTLLQPFRGIFQTTIIGRNHVLDFSTLFAMVIYALFGVAIIAVLRFLGSATDRAHHVGKKSK
ncbi:MAG: YggT family protein [Candidatus Saccharimonadales bacterium]